MNNDTERKTRNHPDYMVDRRTSWPIHGNSNLWIKLNIVLFFLVSFLTFSLNWFF
jgi:hypothetical protein